MPTTLSTMVQDSAIHSILTYDRRIADIVAVTGLAASALPLMLIVAAIMSQFSAGVADTVGAGGLAHAPC